MNESYNDNLNNKEKRGFKIPLIIIAILIVLLVSVGIITFLNKKRDNSPENIYYTIIDRMESKIANVVSENSKIFTKLSSYSGNIKVSYETNNADLKNIANILNNLDISFTDEIDYQNKINNSLINLTYQNKKIGDFNLLLKDEDIYFDLGSIYNKPIKLVNENYNDIWNLNYTNDLKIIISEFAKIFKNNLKEEYFQKENTTLEINNKKTNVTNYIMKMSKDELNSMQKNIFDSLLNNSKIITSLSHLYNLDETSLKEKINSYKLEDFKDDLEINTYIDKNERLLKMTIKMHNILIIEKSNNNTYQITKEVEEVKSNLGSVTINGTIYNFNLENEGVKLEGSLTNKSNKYDFDITMTSDDSIYNMSYQTKNNNGEITLKIEDNETSFNLDINYTLESISKINEFDTSNYIDINMITSEDIGIIVTNLLNNEGFKLLSEDLNLLSFENLFDTSFGSGTEELI